MKLSGFVITDIVFLSLLRNVAAYPIFLDILSVSVIVLNFFNPLMGVSLIFYNFIRIKSYKCINYILISAERKHTI